MAKLTIDRESCTRPSHPGRLVAGGTGPAIRAIAHRNQRRRDGPDHPFRGSGSGAAAALGCRVEDLFNLRLPERQGPRWAWPPLHEPCRYWAAEVGGTERFYPVGATPMGVIPHDGIYRNGSWQGEGLSDPRRTLVMACCDPAVGLLAAELARTADVRLIALGARAGCRLRCLARAWCTSPEFI